MRLDIEQAQFAGRLVVAAHQENRSDDRAVALGDPGLFARRVEALDEITENARRESLERPVPAIFLAIKRALAMNDPADVADARRSQGKARIDVFIGRG